LNRGESERAQSTDFFTAINFSLVVRLAMIQRFMP
jgi:hypothetical protein